MSAPGNVAVSAEQESHRNSNYRRGRGRGERLGHRNSGTYQKWVPSESGFSSSDAPRSKGLEISEKSDATVESSWPTTSNEAPGISHNALSSSKNTNYRTSDKIQSSDPKPSHGRGRAAKGNNWNGSQVGAIHNRGEVGNNVGAEVIENKFVLYLPQDDAVVAGLGEREGGVDASETQRVTDLLNEQLSILLCFPPRQFWKKVAADKSLSVFLDSYLHFRRRWFDNPVGSIGGSNASVIAGDGDLSRRAFMVLFRMSSNHDPGTPASESLSAKEYAAILLERKLLDIPKLMDISAIYGHDNPDLTRRLVSNVFKAQPTYSGELAAYIPPLLERIITMHQRCCATIEAISHPSDKGITAAGVTRVHGELLQVVDFLNDVMITLKAFVKAYPPAAKILVSSGNPVYVSGEGLFLQALASVHDTLLPILQKGFTVLNGSAVGQSYTVEVHGQEKDHVDIAAQDLLCKLSERVVDLSWKLFELRYLTEPSAEELEVTGAASNISYEDAVWKGDALVQAIAILVMGPSENNDDAGEPGSSATRLICTGALIRTMERCHGLSHHIRQACHRGVVVLDDAQQEYLSALISDNKPLSGGQDNSLMISTEAFPQLTLPEREVEEEAAIQQSKISQIKDLFPDYGDGFIAACLEAYDSDPEKVIQRILEGTLHSDLLLLDTSLTTKLIKMAPTVNDKGKGKVSEQPISNKGKSIWEEKASSTKDSGSSSSLVGSSDAATAYSEGTLPPKDSVTDSGAKGGRFVRRQQGDGTFSELLDSRNGNKELRAAIKAAAAQIEYEDEYDDSFDELGGYVADAGGNEETESLADQVAHRGRAQNENVGLRNKNTGRPVVLTPWGTDTANGRRYSAVAPKAKFEPQRSSTVVPEVESPYHDTPTDSSAGPSQGGRGRGRKKWKEQGPKPEFYLKDGKLYSYKVAGAVGVSNVEEAEAIKQEQAQTVFGLGAGGNLPLQPEDTSSARRKTDGTEKSKFGQGSSLGEGGKQHPGVVGEGGRGRGASSRGRGSPGRGSNGRRDDNHRRKDQAMKKHFGGLGGV